MLDPDDGYLKASRLSVFCEASVEAAGSWSAGLLLVSMPRGTHLHRPCHVSSLVAGIFESDSVCPRLDASELASLQLSKTVVVLHEADWQHQEHPKFPAGVLILILWTVVWFAGSHRKNQ